MKKKHFNRRNQAKKPLRILMENRCFRAVLACSVPSFFFENFKFTSKTSISVLPVDWTNNRKPDITTEVLLRI